MDLPDSWWLLPILINLRKNNKTIYGSNNAGKWETYSILLKKILDNIKKCDRIYGQRG